MTCSARTSRHWAVILLIAVLSLLPIPKARAGFFIGISGANFAFSINSGLGVYSLPAYAGYVYCTDVFCYRWGGYGWYYAPWGGGPWVVVPVGFLLPPPLVYGPPPPLVVVYRPYFIWWRSYIGPWYAIHHPYWWRVNRIYLAHYGVWREHVVRVYGPRISSAVWVHPRLLGMRPHFIPQGHPDGIRWAQRQWARNRPELYGPRAQAQMYRAHPAWARREGHPYGYARRPYPARFGHGPYRAYQAHDHRYGPRGAGYHGFHRGMAPPPRPQGGGIYEPGGRPRPYLQQAPAHGRPGRGRGVIHPVHCHGRHVCWE